MMLYCILCQSAQRFLLSNQRGHGKVAASKIDNIEVLLLLISDCCKLLIVKIQVLLSIQFLLDFYH